VTRGLMSENWNEMLAERAGKCALAGRCENSTLEERARTGR